MGSMGHRVGDRASVPCSMKDPWLGPESSWQYVVGYAGGEVGGGGCNIKTSL